MDTAVTIKMTGCKEHAMSRVRKRGRGEDLFNTGQTLIHHSPRCLWGSRSMSSMLSYLVFLVVTTTTCYAESFQQNITVLDQQPAGSTIGQLGTGIPSALPPFTAYWDNDDANVFEVTTNGTVRLKTKIDRSRKSSYNFLAIASDVIQIQVSIYVLPLNNSAPLFSPASINLTILETAPVESTFYLGSAVDPDFGVGGIARYEIFSGNTNGVFRLIVSLAPNGAKIVNLGLTKTLDYKTTSSYLLRVRAYDTGTPPLYGDLQVNITVKNVYDYQPVFNTSVYNAVVREDARVGTRVLNVFATHQGQVQTGRITISFDQQKSVGDYNDFAINSETGIVSVARSLSFSRQSIYHLTVIAEDSTVVRLQATATIQIQVLDVNLEPPIIALIFLSDDGTAKVTKSANTQDPIAYVSVSYSDQLDGLSINMTLLGGEGYFGLQRVENVVYLVVVSRDLKDAKPSYQMSILAVDSVIPLKSACRNFTLYVVDEDSNGLFFSQNPYYAVVGSAAVPGTFLVAVSLVSTGSGSNISCVFRILPQEDSYYELFYIDRYSGVIVTAACFDCKLPSSYRLTVAAFDPTSSSILTTTSVVVNMKYVFNSPPFFNQSFFSILVPDSTPVSSCVGQVSVSNYAGCSPLKMDRIVYSIGTDAQGPVPFSVTPTAGKICVTGALNAELSHAYDLPITATNEAGFKSSCIVQVNIFTTKRHPPVFRLNQYRALINESLSPGNDVIVVKASSGDRQSQGNLTYQIVGGNFGTVFSIIPNSGYIQLKRNLPPYPVEYNLTVVAVDKTGLMSDIYADVIVNVFRMTSQPVPVFTKQVYEMRVAENAPRGQLVGKVETRYSQRVRYSILASDAPNWFELDSTSGEILTIGQLYYQNCSSVLLTIQALTTDVFNIASFAQVLIFVTGISDNPPAFSTPLVTLELSEDTDAGTLLYVARAVDKYSGTSAGINYLLSETSLPFTIDGHLGELRLARPIQFPSKFSFSIAATVGGSSSRSSAMNVTITTTNSNKNSPVFSLPNYRFTVSGQLQTGSLLGSVAAADSDLFSYGNVTYYLSDVSLSDTFLVDRVTGNIYNKVRLDLSQETRFIFRVAARDGGFPSKSSTTEVTITIQEQLKSPPLLSQSVYKFWVTENQPPFTTLGFIDTSTVAPPNYLTFSLHSPNKYFFVVQSSGEILSSEILDREEISLHRFDVIVSDHGSQPRTGTVSVEVTVLDVNDNSPRFDENDMKRIYVQENQPSGTRIAKIVATDSDNGPNGTVSYRFPQENNQFYGQHFDIDSQTGWISTKEQFDKQSKPEYFLKVVAQDGGQQPRSAICILHLIVGDVTKNELFPPSYYFSLNVTENATPGATITSLATQEYGNREYYIVRGNAFDSFGIDTATGILHIALPLDYESWKFYSLSILIIDNDPDNPVCSIASIAVAVIDPDDFSPQFESDPVALKVRENIPRNVTVFRLTVTDADSGRRTGVTYSIVSQRPSGIDWFQVNEATGSLTVNSEIDFEQVQQIVVVVMATVQGAEAVARKRATMTVILEVVDVNDNAPVFDGTLSNGMNVFEDVAEGAIVSSIGATDADSGDSGRISYQILSGNENGRFYLNPDSGLLSVERSLEQRIRDAYQLNISAADRGRPSLVSTVLITLRVLEGNENSPLFDLPWYISTVLENSPPGTLIATVHAASKANVTYGTPYGLGNNLVSVDSVTGVLTTNVSLDRELTNSFTATVFAKSAWFPAHFSTVTVYVTVLDTNDNAPVFSTSSISLDVPENEGPMVLHTFRASDEDAGANGMISYYITGGNTDSRFYIDKTTGKLTCTPLDREAFAFYNLTVSALDSGSPPRSGAISVLIRVLDDNDNDPVFQQASYSSSVLENASTGTTVLDLEAVDLDEDLNGNVTYTISNEALGVFSINPSTGAITVAYELDRERVALYSFEVTATDNCPYHSRSRVVRVNMTVLDVNDNYPTFSQCLYSASLSTGTPTGQRVLTVVAVDVDDTVNGQVTYDLLATSPLFQVDGRSGEIVTRRLMDAQSVGLHTLQIVARDQGVPPRTDKAVVMIEVGSSAFAGRVVFTQALYNESIVESTPASAPVVTVQASLTGGATGQITYGLLYTDMFTIDPGSGSIRLLNSSLLSNGPKKSYGFVVNATSGAIYNYTSVYISLTYSSDSIARFSSDRYVAYLLENNIRLAPVTQVKATFPRISDSISGSLTYLISAGNTQNAFVVDPPSSGTIRTNVILDREVRDSYRIDIQALVSERQTQGGATVSLTVQVIDVNDNAPFFPLYRPVGVREGVKPGSLVLQVTANDVDLYPALTYQLTAIGSADWLPGDVVRDVFTIDRYSGKIWTAEKLDFESCTSYQLTVKVSDTLQNSSTQILVNIFDENDNAPTFLQPLYEVSISEKIEVGVSVLRVSATDGDSGENGRLTYRLWSPFVDYLRINSTSGEIFTNTAISFDPNQTTLYFVVIATDHGTPQLSSAASVAVQLTESNRKPTFNASSYSVSVLETTAPGSTLLRLTASDPDLDYDNSRLEYSILAGNDSMFLIGQDCGEVYLLGQLSAADVLHHTLKVMVRDRGTPSLNSTATVVIEVLIGEKAPQIKDNEIVVSVQENATVGYLLATINASQTRLLFNITSGNEDDSFAVDPLTGVISVKAPLNYNFRRIYRLVISSVDSAIPTLATFTTIVVNVTEVNNYVPKFPVAYYKAAITENLRSSAYVSTIRAVDQDVGIFGMLKYRLVVNSPSAAGVFTIDDRSGEVYTTKRLIFGNMLLNNFSYVVIAEDYGGWSASVSLTVSVKPEPVQPQFSSRNYRFQAPLSAKPGDVIGVVQAVGDNGLSLKNVIYFLRPENKYFGINHTEGTIYVLSDLQNLSHNRQKRSLSRHKRGIENVTLRIVAQSGFLQRKEDEVEVVILVNHSCDGCTLASPYQSSGLHGTPLILVIVFVVFGVLLITLVAVVCLVIRRRKSKPKETTSLPAIPSQPEPAEAPPTSSRDVSSSFPGNKSYSPRKPSLQMRPLSEQSRSVSSGRGSVEKNEDVDEEISMINAMPSTSPNSRIPDSGIQQDDDTVSELSVHNHREYLARLGIDTSAIANKTIGTYPDGNETVSGRDTIYNQLDSSGRNSVVDDGAIARSYGYRDIQPLNPTNLTSIVNNEEVFSGSYNWDYLVDWGPQFLPMADLFTEIARLKDDGVRPKTKPTQIVPQVPGFSRLPRTVPPPLITDTPPRVAPVTCGPNILPRKPQSPTSSSRFLASSSHSHVPSAHGHPSRFGQLNYSSRSSVATTPARRTVGPKSPISYDFSSSSSVISPPFHQNLSSLGTNSPLAIIPTNSVISPSQKIMSLQGTSVPLHDNNASLYGTRVPLHGTSIPVHGTHVPTIGTTGSRHTVACVSSSPAEEEIQI